MSVAIPSRQLPGAQLPASPAALHLQPLARWREITGALLAPQASISPKYFYDQRGSELFEAITRLPEYYLTRTERALMRRHGGAIAEAVGTGRVVIEPGAGSCVKAQALCRRLRATHFVGVDISADYLRGAIERLRMALPGVDARAVAGDITAGLQLPPDIPRQRRLVFYPGSSIGNFDPLQALALLVQMRALALEGGALLIGIDLPKDRAMLEAAYDDAAGVTAAFNRNVLVHLNRLIGSDFDPRQWQHLALFNQAASRIEMHLQARAAQRVRWTGGGRDFAAGERIHTENSYKHPLPAFTALLRQAGFASVQSWTDARGWYAVVHARA
ncbi:L-histidine N(alpha)-methyltransferase [Alicycliphilus denitrificans]|uniref:L-histidine N(alpha)-methyltransferase n=1 Tax=Alicycliphilus denitrificans TaxID=179636 RepID=UPI00384C3903